MQTEQSTDKKASASNGPPAERKARRDRKEDEMWGIPEGVLESGEDI